MEPLDEITLIDLVGNKPNKREPEFEKPYTSLFKDFTPENKLQKEGEFIQFSKTSDGHYLMGGKKTALVIPTVNRPNDLLKTFDRVASVLRREDNVYTVDIFISQDGEDKLTSNTIEMIAKKAQSELSFCHFEVMTHKNLKTDIDSAYLLLSAHFNFIMDTILINKQYDQIILLEVR